MPPLLNVTVDNQDFETNNIHNNTTETEKANVENTELNNIISQAYKEVYNIANKVQLDMDQINEQVTSTNVSQINEFVGPQIFGNDAPVNITMSNEAEIKLYSSMAVRQILQLDQSDSVKAMIATMLALDQKADDKKTNSQTSDHTDTVENKNDQKNKVKEQYRPLLHNIQRSVIGAMQNLGTSMILPVSANTYMHKFKDNMRRLSNTGHNRRAVKCAKYNANDIGSISANSNAVQSLDPSFNVPDYMIPQYGDTADKLTLVNANGQESFSLRCPCEDDNVEGYRLIERWSLFGVGVTNTEERINNITNTYHSDKEWNERSTAENNINDFKQELEHKIENITELKQNLENNIQAGATLEQKNIVHSDITNNTAPVNIKMANKYASEISSAFETVMENVSKIVRQTDIENDKTTMGTQSASATSDSNQDTKVTTTTDNNNLQSNTNERKGNGFSFGLSTKIIIAVVVVLVVIIGVVVLIVCIKKGLIGNIGDSGMIEEQVPVKETVEPVVEPPPTPVEVPAEETVTPTADEIADAASSTPAEDTTADVDAEKSFDINDNDDIVQDNVDDTYVNDNML